MAKIRAVLLVRRHALNAPGAGWAIGLAIAYVVLAGSTIAYLQDSIYQEVMFWAYAFGAVFVYLAVKGIANRRFDVPTLACMATCAGLALLTRVTAGVGLILATVLLLIALAIDPSAGQTEGTSGPVRLSWRTFAQPRMLIPLGILAAFIAAAGAVNYFRWGNPATFANYDLYLERNVWPGFLPTLHRYGAFNLRRLPFGLMYYFFPVWVLQGPGGQLLFQNTQTRLIGVIELPPGPFLLTHLLPCCFIVLLAVALWTHRSRGLSNRRRWAAAVSLGLLAPCLLMLALAWMIYRYRLEFYPEIDFLTLLGLYLTVTDEASLKRFARFRRWMTASLAISILGSMIALGLYDFSGDESPQELLRSGIVQYYSGQVALHLRHTAERDFGSHP